VKLKATLTVSHVQCSHGENYISISIRDESSHCNAVEVEMDFASFAKALTGHGYQPCMMDFNNSGVVGKVHEYKTENVTFKNPYFLREGPRLKAMMDKALKSFEVDGWEANRDDLLNSHRHKGDFFSVTFHRYVDAK